MVVLNGMHFHELGYLYTVRSVNSTNNLDFTISKCTIIIVTVQANIQTKLDDYKNRIISQECMTLTPKIQTIMGDYSNSILTQYGFQQCST